MGLLNGDALQGGCRRLGSLLDFKGARHRLWSLLCFTEALINGNGSTPHRNAHGKGGMELAFELLLRYWRFS